MANNSAFEAFDKMADKVERIEAEAEAMVELEDMSQTSDIEQEFAALESSGAQADLLLEDLKSRMDSEQGKIEDKSEE